MTQKRSRSDRILGLTAGLAVSLTACGARPPALEPDAIYVNGTVLTLEIGRAHV